MSPQALTKQPHEFKIGDKIQTSYGVVTITGNPWIRPGFFKVIVPSDYAENSAFDQDTNWKLAN